MPTSLVAVASCPSAGLQPMRSAVCRSASCSFSVAIDGRVLIARFHSFRFAAADGQNTNHVPAGFSAEPFPRRNECSSNQGYGTGQRRALVARRFFISPVPVV